MTPRRQQRYQQQVDHYRNLMEQNQRQQQQRDWQRQQQQQDWQRRNQDYRRRELNIKGLEVEASLNKKDKDDNGSECTCEEQQTPFDIYENH